MTDQQGNPPTRSTAQPRSRADAVREIDELARVVVEKRAAIDDLAKERDRARAQLAALKRRPAARVAIASATTVRKVAARIGALGLDGRASAAIRANPILGRVMPTPAGQHRLRAGKAAERTLRAEAIEAARAHAVPDSGERVLAIVRSVGDPALLASCLESLAASTIANLEVVVIEPAAPPAALAGAKPTRPTFRGAIVEVLAHGTNAEAIQAAGPSTAESVLFLHDDVEPLAPSSIGRLVATLGERPGIDAVAGRLILPRRRGSPIGPLDEPADLTVATAGIAFEPRGGLPVAVAIDRGTDPRLSAASEVREVPAAGAACLLVRRHVLDPGRMFLSVDDDLGPALDVRAAGGRIFVDERATFLHGERSEPARADDDGPVPWAHRLHRSVLLDRLNGAGSWSVGGLHLGITVTRDDERAGFGDWYTAHELGDALARLGWRITYLERDQDRWYDPPLDLDAVLVLIDLFDLTRLPPGIVRIAWIRNWTDHWTGREWFDDYDLVLTSSAAAKAWVEANSAARAHVFPIATNPDRFAPGRPYDELATDVAFVGSHFGLERAIARGLPVIAERGVRVGVWGRGWADVPAVAGLDRGPIDYDRVPDVYRSTRIVVDDANEGATRDLGMMNSRVFDALATGTIVITNNVVGAAELMDPDFPTWSTPESLASATAALLADEARADELAVRYRALVLERHTYDRRATELRDILAGWARAERWAVVIGPRTREAARSWGDTYFAHAIQRQLARRGRPTTVHVHDEWASAAGRADVVIHLFGARAPRPTPGPVTLLWVISHPERIDRERCAGYDQVLVASDLFAAELSSRTDVPVRPLHQATDPDRFRPTPGGPVHELLFVGSSRGQRRPMVDAAIASGRDVAVYGGGWTADLLDPRHLRGDWIPNDELAAWYSGAAIVLTDHYDDMRDLAFISNRVYDALASGVFVLSDDVRGLAEEFDGGVIGCGSPAEAVAAIERFLGDPAARREHAQRGRNAVLARHTFGHRADTLVAIVDSLVAGRPMTIEPAGSGVGDA
jgi:spore maturation protein CgeB